MWSSTLKDKRLWLAVLALVATLVRVYVPAFDVAVWASIEALLIVAISILTVDRAASVVARELAASTVLGKALAASDAQQQFTLFEIGRTLQAHEAALQALTTRAVMRADKP